MIKANVCFPHHHFPLTQTDRAGAITGFFLRGSALAGHAVSFVSEVAVSASVAYTAEGVDVEVETPENTGISISVPNRPAAVTVDGEPAEEWTYEAASGRLKLMLSTGHAIIAIR